MARQLDLRIRDLVMATLAPCLVVASVVFATISYRTLYDLILAGFEARLVAASTVTGAFIEGTEHAELLEPSYLVGLTAVPHRPYLLGLDTLQDELVAIDLVQGGARPLVSVPADSLRGLVADGGLVLSHHQRSGWVSVDTASGRIRPTTPPSVLPPDEARLPQPLRDVSRSPGSGAILILAGDPPALFAWQDGAVVPGGVVRWGDEDGAPPRVDGLAFAADGRLYAAGERLVELDPADGTIVGRTYVSGFRSEGVPTYQRYVRPMRRIARSEGITYLYTQTVDTAGRIRYVLDATEGSDHSFIGDLDSLPASEIEPTLRVQTEGDVYITGLKRWVNWGFLKSANAPIVDSAGRPVAMAGADIDISSISRRTRSALARVAFFGVLVLGLGGLVSLWISQRLTQPLAALEAGALRLAAGQLGSQVLVSGPKEVRRLITRFNDMSRALETRITALNEQGRLLQKERAIRELASAAGDAAALEACPGLTLSRVPDVVDGSGAAPMADGSVAVWLADPTTSATDALRSRATLHRLMSRLTGPRARELDLLPHLEAFGVHTMAILEPGGSGRISTSRPRGGEPGGDGAGDRTRVHVVEVGPGASLDLHTGAQDGGPRFRAVLLGASEGGTHR